MMTPEETEEYYQRWRQRQGIPPTASIVSRDDEPGIRRAAAAQARNTLPLDDKHLADMAHRTAQQYAATARDVARLERVYVSAFLESVRLAVAAAGGPAKVLPNPETGRYDR
jgi:hypothetical protein